MSSLRAEMKLNQAEFENTGDSAEYLRKKSSLLQSQLEANRSKQEALTAKLEAARKTYGDNSEEVSKLEKQLTYAKTEEQKLLSQVQKTNDEIDEQADASKKSMSAMEQLTQEIESQEKELKDLKSRYADAILQYGEASDEARGLASEITDLSSDLGKNKTAVKNAEDAADNLTDASEDLADASEEAGDSAQQAGSSFDEWTVAIGNLISNAIETCVSKVKELANQIYELGVDTETAFAKLETIAGTENIDNLSSSISTLAKETGVSSAELANVAYNAISAGSSAEDACDMVEAATKLATAGFTDAESALSVLSTAMNSYGDEAGTVSDISDSLIMVQNLGVTTIDELSGAMGKAIATGSAYSVSLGNLESAYVSVTKAGISTEEATTYLNSMLNELGDSGSDVSAILQEETGKSFTELMEDGNSLSDVLGILYDLCGEDSTALMNLWSSAEAGKASNAIVNQGLEEFNENLDAITNSAGATESAYATMADTTATKIEIMKTSFEELGLKIYDKLEGPLNTAITFITDTVIPGLESFGTTIDGIIENTDFTNIKDGIQKVSDALTPLVDTVSGGLSEAYDNVLAPLADWAIDEGLPGVLDGAASALDAMSEAAGWVIDNFDKLEPVLAAVTAAIVAYKAVTLITNGVTTAMTTAQAALNAVMNANPIMIVVTLIAALVAALVMLYNNNEQVREAIDNAWTSIKEAVSVAVEWFQTYVQPVIEQVVQAVSSFFTDTLLPALETAWTSIQEAISTVVEWFQTYVQPVIDTVFGAISTFFTDTFMPAVTGVWDTISSAVSTVVEWFQNTAQPGIEQVMDAVAGAFQSAWELIKTVWDLVKPYFEAVWKNIKTIFSVVKSVLGGFFSAAWTAIKGVWNVVSNYFTLIWENIKAVFSVVKDVLSGFFKAAWTAIKAVWDVVVAYFTTIWNTISGIFSVVKSVLSGDFQGAWDAIKGIFSGFADFFQTAWNSVKKIFGAVGTFFKDAFQSAWDGIKKIFSNVGTFFSDTFDTIVDTFTNIGSTVSDAISGAVKGAINSVLSTAAGIINGFIGAINTAISVINAIPGVNISKLDEIDAPQLAQGGILPEGQVGILEGDGDEAVIPLSQNTEWISNVAGELAGMMPTPYGDYVSSNVESALCDSMDTLTAAISALAARPVQFSINGRNFAMAASGDIDSVLGARQTLTARGLSLA